MSDTLNIRKFTSVHLGRFVEKFDMFFHSPQALKGDIGEYNPNIASTRRAIDIL